LLDLEESFAMDEKRLQDLLDSKQATSLTCTKDFSTS